MITIRDTRKSVLLPAVTLAVLFSAIHSASAEELLRWKFTPGQKLNYQIVQDTNMSMAGGPMGAMNTNMSQTMDMTWNVDSVDESGNAIIKQTFDRVRMKMTMPGMGGIEYDSESEESPAGMAALVAPTFEAMTQHPLQVTMSPRGEIIDVEIPDEMMQALQNNAGAGAMGALATKEGFQQILQQGAMELPEKPVEAGHEWSTKMEVDNPMVGKQVVTTDYRYAGTKEVDGAKMAVFEPKVTITIEGAGQNPGMQMNVKDQESSGEILFNQDAGRMSSSNLTQKMTFEISVGGQTMEQQIDQKVEVKVSEAKEEEVAAAE